MSDDDTLLKHIEHSDRRERLHAAREPSPVAYNPGYSVFVRRMRLILPLIAVILIGVVFTWSNMGDETIISAEDPAAPKTIGKNELLNPKFESVDDKNQPYTIVAKRALQGNNNDDIVILEEPLADMLLNSGNWVAIKAKQGAFSQEKQSLLLRGDVELFHDKGYQMSMPELHVNMDKNTARTDKDVKGHGPLGTLEAKGLSADSAKGHLSFTGPAKLVLYQGQTGADLGGLVGE
ncbi:MAG: LPS export ABC transporter periplasmic protein LptC [Pseudomonadota bacterium]